MVELVPFAGWTLNSRGFRRGPKSWVDVGHTGKYCEGWSNDFSYDASPSARKKI